VIKSISFFLFITMLHSGVSLVQADIPKKGRPFTQYYSPSDYRAGSGTSNAVQDSLGVFYFSNDEGVLVFDGIEWSLIPIKNNKPVYWVAINNDGKILVASTGEIGYLYPQSNGELVYKSLLSSSADMEFENVWEIAITSKEVLFRSRKLLIHYQNGVINPMQIDEAGYDVAFSVKDTVYTRVRGKGLYYLDNGQLKLVARGEFFADTKLNCYLPYEDKLLIGKRNGELYLMAKGKIEPFITEADGYLKEHKLYDACITQSGDYAFCTTLSGVVIIDKEGKLLQVLDESSGLPDYQYSFVGAAGLSSLWMTHAVGISRAEILSPISYFNKSHGITAVVTDLKIFNESLYITTLKGFFQYNEKNKQFVKLSDGFTQEFHGLSIDNNQLLVVGHDGIMTFKSGKLVRRAKRFIHELNKSIDTDLMYAGSGEGGFEIIKKGKKDYQAFQLEGFSERLKKIIPFGKEVVLVCTSGKLVFVDVQEERLQIESKIMKTLNIGSFDAVKIEDELLVVAKEGWSILESNGNQSEINALPISNDIYKVQITSDVQNNTFWVCYKDEDRINYCEKLLFENGELVTTTDKFKSEYRINTILRGKDNIDWFGGDQGIMRFDNNAKVQNKTLPLYCHISKTIFNNDSILSNYGFKAKSIDLPYEGKSLQFNYYSDQSFVKKDEIMFQYKLTGLDKEWSSWSNKSSKEYSNLNPNKYIFQVRAKNGLGSISNIDALSFVISPPWYLSIYSFFGYSILVVLASFGYTRWRTINLKRSKIMLSKLIQGRTIEVELQKQSIEEQKEVLRQANATKDQLFSIIGHDLRGPLNSIQGLTELIRHYRSEKKSEKVDELMRHMNDSVKRLSHLLDNLLSWALNQSGNFKSKIEEINLSFLLQEVEGIFKETAIAKNINIKLIVEEKLILRADQNSLATILRNLVGNAIKFTNAQGEIVINAQTKEESISIEISDNGVGIPENKLEDIFELDNSSYGTSNEKGTGLGLVLVKEFMDKNNGQLAVKSNLDEGTKFILTFPKL
jgi:signal transduction histidine kinase